MKTQLISALGALLPKYSLDALAQRTYTLPFYTKEHYSTYPTTDRKTLFGDKPLDEVAVLERLIEQTTKDDFVVAELFSGHGRKTLAVSEEVDTKGQSVHYLLLDKSFSKIDLAHFADKEKVSAITCDLLKVNPTLSGKVDFAFVCLHTPTLTNLSTEEMHQFFISTYDLLAPGGTLLLGASIVSAYDEGGLAEPSRYTIMGEDGQPVEVISIQGTTVINHQYEAIEEICALVRNGELLNIYHFRGEGNYVYSPQTVNYLAKISGLWPVAAPVNPNGYEYAKVLRFKK